jgi:hypothetical protein
MFHNYRPIWVGTNYDSGGIFDKKIMIIGESTYNTEGKDTSQYNILQAEDHISLYREGKQPKRWTQYRERLVKAFINKNPLSLNDVVNFWHSVVFFNFVEDTLTNCGVRPTQEQWNSHRPIEKVFEKYTPNIVVLTSCDLYDWWENYRPVKLIEGYKIIGAQRDQTFQHLSDNGNSILVYGMRHPSACSPSKEYRYLNQIGVRVR